MDYININEIGFHLPNLVGEEDCTSIDNFPGQCIQITNCQSMGMSLIPLISLWKTLY